MSKQLGRRKPQRPIGRVLHIFCEDLKSARYYLQGYTSDRQLGKYISLEPHEHTDPRNLVNDAKALKEKSPANDEFWVVYDSESIQQRDTNEHKLAWQDAIKSGINIALSCVSFETWILLHHTYSTRGFSTSNQLESYIKKKFDQQYDKGDTGIYARLNAKTETAQIHAKRLEAHNHRVNADKKPYEINPFTDIHKLLNAMDNFRNH